MVVLQKKVWGSFHTGFSTHFVLVCSVVLNRWIKQPPDNSACNTTGSNL